MPDPTPRAAAARRFIYDPELVPLDDAFVPAVRGRPVPPERLDPAALRARLGSPPDWQPEMTGDDKLRMLTEPPRPASVLVPLVVREGRVSVLLTQRTSHLHDHAGQISFPGGRQDEGDTDVIATALRESQEEIGLDPELVDVIGTMPRYVTITGYRVTPVVALIERPFSLRLDEFEVDEAFEVPLPFLMNPANHERRRFEWDGQSRTFYAMPYAQSATRRYFIWGATAAMLRNFYHLLAA